MRGPFHWLGTEEKWRMGGTSNRYGVESTVHNKGTMEIAKTGKNEKEIDRHTDRMSLYRKSLKTDSFFAFFLCPNHIVTSLPMSFFTHFFCCCELNVTRLDEPKMSHQTN